MPNLIFLNDKIVKDTEGLLSTLDRGFLYGDGLFETLRTYEQKPFRLEDHVARISNSAHYFDIPFRYTSQQIRQIIEQLLTGNNLKDAYIRMTLSRGVGVNGLIPKGTCTPTFVVHAKPLITYPALLYKTGVSLITSHIRRSATCPISCHKTLNFLTNYLIKREATEKGAHDALILNTDNFIAECAVSNIFVVEKSAVITPPLKANVLPGITRKIVLDLCKENGIYVLEELFGMERILGANEVFITNSLMEIMPVSRIDGHTVGKPTPDTITKLLHHKYKSLKI
jgi:branched-chain amino acid aminotransferase